MKLVRFFLVITIAGFAVFSASPTLAASLQSSSYELANPVFGTQLSISTNQDSVGPVISSDGPTVTELTSNTAVITWKTDKASTSSVAYGTSTKYGQQTGGSDLTTTHSVTVGSLKPEQLYHYQVISTDSFGTQGASTDHTFTTTAELGITTIKISQISYDYALVTFSTGGFTTATIDYGTTTKYGKTAVSTSSAQSTDHAVELKGLTAGTDYHVRIIAKDDKDNTQTSSDFSFSTIPAPSFTSLSVVSINPNQINVVTRTNTATSIVVHYKVLDGPGLSTATDLTSANNDYNANHSLTLGELFGQTTYQYYAVATDQQGHQVTSATKTFVTLTDTQKPEITDLKVVTSTSGNQLIITATWKTNKPTKGSASYAPKNNPSKSTDVDGSADYSVNHTIISPGLSPATPYTFTAKSVDPYNNNQTADISFVTPKLNKSILQLLLDTFTNSFGWLQKLFAK